MTGLMESALKEFLQDSGSAGGEDKGRKRRVEGVWVVCRGAADEEDEPEREEDESDEMIWWSWDGKLVGFSDW